MAVKLQGTAGYFAREIEIDGSKFQIREWSDEFGREVALQRPRQAAEMLGVPLDQLKDVESATAALQAADLEVAYKALAFMRETTNLICLEGLAGWDLDEEFTAENVRRLPSHVKKLLETEIGRESRMESSEADFSPPSPRPL